MFSRKKILLLTLIFEGGLGILALILGFLFQKPATQTWFWSFQGLMIGVLSTIPPLIFFSLLYKWPIGPLVAIRRFLDEVIYPLFCRCSTAELALISLIAGVGEELLFRGVAQNLFGQWLGPQMGWIIASILFGLCHFITPAYAFLTTIVGLYLGWLWIATGNLLVPITVHALYDFLALLFFIKISPPSLPKTDPIVDTDSQIDAKANEETFDKSPD